MLEVFAKWLFTFENEFTSLAAFVLMGTSAALTFLSFFCWADRKWNPNDYDSDSK